ncbi:unnamed protein product [Closterium sp. NIES-53]
MPRTEHRSEPALVRCNTSSAPSRQPLDAPRLVRACTTTNRGMCRDSQNDSLPTPQNPTLSSRPAHSSGCVTASQHPPPPSRFAPSGSVNFDFHDAASDWVRAVASSLRGEYVVAEPPAPGRNQSTESVPEKPVQGERSKMAQQLDFRIQLQQQEDAKHEKKLSLSEILQWEAEMVSSVCPKARPAPPTVKIPVFGFSDPLEVKPAVPAPGADVEAERLDDKLFIDELLMEFGVEEEEAAQPQQEQEQQQQMPQVQAAERQSLQQQEQQYQEQHEQQQQHEQPQQHDQPQQAPAIQKRPAAPPLVDIANVAATAPSMFADMYSMATPAAAPFPTPTGWGSNAWDPAVPPTPSGIPPTPSAPAGGFASLWSEAWTDGFNVDLSSLAGNPALW